MLAIKHFFGVAHALDQRRRGFFAEPLPEDGAVALPEGGKKLFVRNGATFASHRIAPRLPVVVGRVDEGSIHIPKHGTGASHIQ